MTHVAESNAVAKTIAWGSRPSIKENYTSVIRQRRRLRHSDPGEWLTIAGKPFDDAL
jgi:hypothetical protein